MNLKQRREVFKRIASHLLKQQAKSHNHIMERCAYRGDNGRMCAIGCIITDEFYSEELENIVVTDSPVREAVEDSLGLPLIKEDMDMFWELQSLHDSCPIDKWRQQLNELAIIYKLV